MPDLDNLDGYKTVAQRVRAFYTEHPKDYAIREEIKEITEDYVVVHAWLEDNKGRVIADGHALEFLNSGGFQGSGIKVVECCSTHAIGRALAAAGYMGKDFASENEIERCKAEAKEKKGNPMAAPAPAEPEKPKGTKTRTRVTKEKPAETPAKGGKAVPTTVFNPEAEYGEIKTLAELGARLRKFQAERENYQSDDWVSVMKFGKYLYTKVNSPDSLGTPEQAEVAAIFAEERAAYAAAKGGEK